MEIGKFTPEQALFMRTISAEEEITKRFYFGEGTCLSVHYLQHRWSEDLDFFSEEEVDPQGIMVFIQSKKKDLGFQSLEFQTSFNRNLFFLTYPNEVLLKAEFTFYPFPRIDTGQIRDGMPIDSLRDIAVNKLFTIHQRPRGRDYYDLFAICQREGWDTASLLRDARIKFDTVIDPLQLASQLDAASAAHDDPILSEGSLVVEQAVQWCRQQADTFSRDILE